LVDGKKVKTPSYKVEPGQNISFKKEKNKENKLIKNNLERNVKTPLYLNLDRQKLIINYLRYPLPEELNKNIFHPLVVE
jgi:small subunit ribosomal protein S4